jgi:hypothetical protein
VKYFLIIALPIAPLFCYYPGYWYGKMSDGTSTNHEACMQCEGYNINECKLIPEWEQNARKNGWAPKQNNDEK